MEKLHKIIQLIITRINTPAFVEKHKTNSTDFTRKKKIGFTDTFLFVMTLVKTCLDFDLVHFSKVFEIPKVYPSAITQRRAQIQYTAFEEIFERTAEEIPSDKMFEGYRIIAFDGMTGELPRTPELIGEYGLVGGSFYPQFHAVAAYDVLNGYFLYADWTKKAISDERQSVISLVQSKTFPEKSIFVLDRGFVGTKLIHTLLKHEHKFVIRSTNSTFSEIQKFMSSDLTESNVGITITKKRANWNKMNTFEIEMPFTFELRCVKVELDSGEVETLLTNLTAAEMTANKMKELYWLRWGIETSFNYLKNAINIETFIGIKDNSLKQEFYAGLTVYNLVKIMTSQAQGVYDSKKNDKAHV